MFNSFLSVEEEVLGILSSIYFLASVAQLLLIHLLQRDTLYTNLRYKDFRRSRTSNFLKTKGEWRIQQNISLYLTPERHIQ